MIIVEVIHQIAQNSGTSKCLGWLGATRIPSGVVFDFLDPKSFKAFCENEKTFIWVLCTYQEVTRCFFSHRLPILHSSGFTLSLPVRLNPDKEHDLGSVISH